jgi:hypothetical protein
MIPDVATSLEKFGDDRAARHLERIVSNPPTQRRSLSQKKAILSSTRKVFGVVFPVRCYQ